MPAVPVTRDPSTLTETSVLAVIPARFHSSRLPGKALLDIGGVPMIELVYRRASAARTIDLVIVATDDERIARAVTGFGGLAQMTSATHVSGSDRIAEVAASLPCGIIVNVQGDEPLIDPAVIDAVVEPLVADPSIEITTASRPVRDAAELNNPHVVKVVSGSDGFALFFSRAPIPYGRDGSALSAARAHIGLYAHRRDTLVRLARQQPTPLEQVEMLEQLRALERGVRIKVVETQYESIGVDTPADLEHVRQRLLAIGASRVMGASGLPFSGDG